MTYLYHELIMIGLYAILALSLNLILGYGGMISLCHATFYGLGAYTSALLIVRCGWSFASSASIAILLTYAIGYLIGSAFTRFEGDSFVLATLALQIAISSILSNWTQVTLGPYGIPGIPRPIILGTDFSSPPRFLGLTAAVTFLVWLVSWRISSSPFGRALQATRDDAIAASSLGKNARKLRRTAFAASAGLASIAGVLYASYSSYIDATSFDLNEALFLLFILIVGGTGNMWAPLLGAVVIVLLPEGLRFISIADNAAANVREVVYGVLLILTLRYRPRGIGGTFSLD